MAREPSAAADETGDILRGPASPAAATSGRAMRLARWLGVAFAELQFTL